MQIGWEIKQVGLALAKSPSSKSWDSVIIIYHPVPPCSLSNSYTLIHLRVVLLVLFSLFLIRFLEGRQGAGQFKSLIHLGL